MLTLETVFFSLLGGFIPALFWLWFWLREDTIHPEPRGLIVLAFLGGMLAAPLAYPLEKWVREYTGYDVGSGTLAISFITFLLWAMIEEFLKFAAAYFTAIDKKTSDEPIDALMYLITAALGFTAMENTFFLLGPLSAGNITESILTGNLRFIGASLLHTVCSATIGLFIALAFYHKPKIKKLAIIGGMFTAVLLHTLFNFFIIQKNNTFLVFASVWMGVVILLIAFEKVKTIRPHKRVLKRQ